MENDDLWKLKCIQYTHINHIIITRTPLISYFSMTYANPTQRLLLLEIVFTWSSSGLLQLISYDSFRPWQGSFKLFYMATKQAEQTSFPSLWLKRNIAKIRIFESKLLNGRNVTYPDMINATYSYDYTNLRIKNNNKGWLDLFVDTMPCLKWIVGCHKYVYKNSILWLEYAYLLFNKFIIISCFC